MELQIDRVYEKYLAWGEKRYMSGLGIFKWINKIIKI